MYRIQIKDMDFEQIARSGQCFRMEGREDENGVWTIAAGGEYVEAVKDGDSFLFSCGEREFKETWAGYFDLQTDYDGYKKHVDSNDTYLRDAMEWGWGVRILQQDLWEMLVTFLISQNNNITRITGSVKELCKRYGDKRRAFLWQVLKGCPDWVWGTGINTSCQLQKCAAVPKERNGFYV